MRRLALVLLLAAATATACGGDDDGSGSADPAFCDTYGELLVGPLADVETDVTDPAVLERAVADTNALLTSLIDGAPADLQDDAMALTAEYQAAFAVLEANGYDLAAIPPADQAALDDFGANDSEAFTAIGQWVADHCATDVTLPDDINGGTDGTGATTTNP